jgi:hypothetical protein
MAPVSVPTLAHISASTQAPISAPTPIRALMSTSHGKNKTDTSTNQLLNQCNTIFECIDVLFLCFSTRWRGWRKKLEQVRGGRADQSWELSHAI